MVWRTGQYLPKIWWVAQTNFRVSQGGSLFYQALLALMDKPNFELFDLLLRIGEQRNGLDHFEELFEG